MSDFNEIEIVTSVDLNYSTNNDKKPAYHIVYASQLYGTVFAIYGRFEGTETNVGAEKAYAIDKISLALLNYKGIINIGFTSDDFAWGIEKDENNFSFGVQGTSTLVDHTVSLSSNPLIIKKGIPSHITFNRTLYPLPGFEGYLSNRPGNAPNPSRQLIAQPPIAPIFDSEFNDRDGTDFYNRDLKPGMARHRQLEGSALIGGGPRCIQSNVRLLYY